MVRLDKIKSQGFYYLTAVAFTYTPKTKYLEKKFMLRWCCAKLLNSSPEDLYLSAESLSSFKIKINAHTLS